MIAFLSDFGLRDPYVGIVKGVIAKRSPSSKVIDITHDITPGNIREASFILSISFSYFPSKTVFLTVVDPGVGSERKGIIVEAGGYLFVGPDNGIFTHVLKGMEEGWSAYEIMEEALDQKEEMSSTFHARDLFGPVAALLDMGIPVEKIGKRVEEIEEIGIKGLDLSGDSIVGEVVYFDRFGNAITNIPSALVPENATILVKGMPLTLVGFYEEGKAKLAFGILGSHGYLEISSYLKSVQETLGLKEGDEIFILKKASS